jgi:hypothetical protein
LMDRALVLSKIMAEIYLIHFVKVNIFKSIGLN